MFVVVQYEVETIEYSKLRDLTLIGEGGFGEVYRANHSDWGPVAFKKLTVTFIRETERYFHCCHLVVIEELIYQLIYLSTVLS